MKRLILAIAIVAAAMFGGVQETSAHDYWKCYYFTPPNGFNSVWYHIHPSNPWYGHYHVLHESHYYYSYSLC